MSEGMLRYVVEVLLKYYGMDVNPEEFSVIKALRDELSPLAALISIILSQNTSDRNAIKALTNFVSRLGKRFDIDDLRKLSINELEDMIRPSGMYRLKASTILNLIKKGVNNEVLTKEDPEKLKELLSSIPGIGYKTIDVFLLMVRDYPTFPIDTHIRRVLTRLGFIRRNESYESIRAKVMKELPSSLYLKAHLVLIRHGRETCKSRKPKCDSCPIRNICPKINVKSG